MMVDTFELPWLAGREDVVALLARAVSCLPRMMRGLKARTRVHAPGRMAIDSPWARAIDLFLGASILGARSLRLTRGWWELKRLPVPAVFDYGFALSPDMRFEDYEDGFALSPEDDGYGWHEYLIRHVRHGFGGEVVTLYQDRGNPRVRGERTRNGPMRELPHLRQIEFDRERGRIVEALASFGGDVPKTKDELLDAAKVAPNEWSRAMFALAMAMRDEHR